MGGAGLIRSGWKTEKGYLLPYSQSAGVCQAVGVGLTPPRRLALGKQSHRGERPASLWLSELQESGRMQFKHEILWSDLQKFLDIWKLMKGGEGGKRRVQKGTIGFS